MQTSLTDLLNREHVRLGIQARDAQDAIQQLTDALVQTGHVQAEFAADVWAREQIYPTGLPTQPIPVAIPHADPAHVHASAVCIGVLQAPVQFGQMGTDGSTLLEARLVFLLAIKEVEKQVQMIQQLMTVLQTPSLLEGLSDAGDADQALALVRGTLS